MIYILIPVFIVFFPPALFFLYLVLTEYKPKDVEETIRYRKTRDNTHYASYNIVSYNIGYCSNDKVSKKRNLNSKYSVKIDSETVYDNLIVMTNILKDVDCDFSLLQEVDQASSRSGKIDQVEHLTSDIKEMNSSFAYNYNAKYIPFPLNHPVGGTYSGLLTLSKFPAITSKRYQLEGHESFPKSLFYLKRCMLVEEYQLAKKKLIVINLHLSSFDKNNLFRTEQFHHMLRFIEKQYDGRKNAIIVGGDFNYLLNKDDLQMDTPDWLERLPEEFYDSKFKPVYPKTGHTMLSDGKGYTIDGFLVSPNIKVQHCKVIEDNFEHSNHNPVLMSFTV